MRSFLTISLLLWATFSQAQEIEASYVFSGMGSNMGQAFPVFKIKKGHFVYTKEVNSSWSDEQLKPADTILTGKVKRECLEGLKMVLTDLGDTTIYDTNFGVMSGGIHSISVSDPTKEVKISLHNGWHSQAQRIVDLLNLNIPDTNKFLWLSDEKWGSEYAEKRITILMDSLRAGPESTIVRNLIEYKSYQYNSLGHTAYYIFAFDFVYAFYDRFFLSMKGANADQVKDWVVLAAIGLKWHLELNKNPKAEIERLSDNFKGRIEELPQLNRDFAMEFWKAIIARYEKGFNSTDH